MKIKLNHVVEHADKDDVKELIKFALRANRELDTPHRILSVDKRAIKKTLDESILGVNSTTIVCRVGGRIEGALIGVTTSPWYTKEKVAADHFFYTSDKARGHGSEMVRKYLIWARDQPRIRCADLSMSSAIDIERTGRFYEVMGGELIGHIYRVDFRKDDNEEDAA